MSEYYALKVYCTLKITCRSILRVDDTFASLDDVLMSIAAGARGPTEQLGGTGRFAISSSKRVIYKHARGVSGEEKAGIIIRKQRNFVLKHGTAGPEH